MLILDEGDRVRSRFGVPYGAELHRKEGDVVQKGDVIYEWDPYSDVILSDKNGIVQYQDIIEDVTVKEKIDEKTGKMQMVIIEDRDKKHHPQLQIVDTQGRAIGNFLVPTGAYLLVKDGQEVHGGAQLCKIPKDISRTSDITGGLPRVAELFEVRKPKESAIISEIDGVVEFGPISRGMRKIIVKNENGEEKSYVIPQGKHLRVYQGDRVEAGDNLTEGPINPFDILNIKGVNAAQEYLVNGIQEVYRLQGVKINDKHIETIVRQMLQKVQVEDAGDTVVPRGRSRGQDHLPRREREGADGRRKGGDLQADASRDHQGVALDREFHLGGELPGDDARADRRGGPRQDRLPLRSQRERDHGAPHPGGYRAQGVRPDRSSRSKKKSEWISRSTKALEAMGTEEQEPLSAMRKEAAEE